MLQLSEVTLTLTLAVNFMFAFVMCLFALCAGGTFMKRSGSACHMFGADEGNFFFCVWVMHFMIHFYFIEGGNWRDAMVTFI